MFNVACDKNVRGLLFPVDEVIDPSILYDVVVTRTKNDGDRTLVCAQTFHEVQVVDVYNI
ncbi:hypothetical protein COU57_06570 [Candidatus Pacearchaeota archaeon CG10_big_fil_rev_8_21_14_0_10_32_14]|nr:MAG: hypothetical protein COU57_06570 [Candidatus Pacearchaeota archaeon CG10_big_fil_rev_8_21_14_0_10_32_14]